MPGRLVPDWVENPSHLVDKLFEGATISDPVGFRKHVEQEFQKRILDAKDHYKYFIPSIDGMDLDSLKALQPGVLVRFRCMVQSERSNSYHQPFLYIRNSVSGAERTVCGMFKEEAKLEAGDEILYLGDPTKLCEMRSLNCISVPGETYWVHNENYESTPLSVTANFFAQAGTDLNINDMYELFGVLHILPNEESPETKSSDSSTQKNAQADVRFNVIFYEPLLHSHPTLPNNRHILEAILLDVCHVREFLLNSLRGLLHGDRTAAEYLLFHLVSAVYSRKDEIAVGSFPLNLINLNAEPACNVTNLLKQFLPTVFSYHMNIKNLNDSRLAPKLNTETDSEEMELFPGLLQLTKHTHLIVDETGMDVGTLNDSGVRNLLALQKLVNKQELEMDYFTQKVQLLVDVPALVLSQGRSLVACRFILPVIPDLSYSAQTLPANTVSLIRQYLIAAKFAQLELDSDMQKMIVEEFVEKRKTDRSISSEWLSNHLELARYLCISYGEKILTKERWDNVLELEKERINRLKEFRAES